ncbi:hypothetical protein AAFF_G00410000 [Aldrovandia affinis]|uniref:Myb/SANT-like DNA-binding domain-containing protein n=1 Tax=Aldrovandia affinis TaxID=143900 RepID=A0AAD7SBP9_9TELE|nr:hypothetical protein AAFF_G00410000 [Aldrovandia affinis]
MDKGKIKHSKNFSEIEKTLLKEIVLKYPTIENKQHDSGTENNKKNAWTAILNEFNSNEKVANRTLQQLQVLWKNIKINFKKTTAVACRERFKTGGGPPVRPETDDLGDLLTGIIKSQQPLEGIPDDDHLDSAEEDYLILAQILEGPGQSQEDQPAAASSSQQQPVSLTLAAGQGGKG